MGELKIVSKGCAAADRAEALIRVMDHTSEQMIIVDLSTIIMASSNSKRRAPWRKLQTSSFDGFGSRLHCHLHGDESEWLFLMSGCRATIIALLPRSSAKLRTTASMQAFQSQPDLPPQWPTAEPVATTTTATERTMAAASTGAAMTTSGTEPWYPIITDPGRHGRRRAARRRI